MKQRIIFHDRWPHTSFVGKVPMKCRSIIRILPRHRIVRSFCDSHLSGLLPPVLLTGLSVKAIPFSGTSAVWRNQIPRSNLIFVSAELSQGSLICEQRIKMDFGENPVNTVLLFTTNVHNLLLLNEETGNAVHSALIKR